MNKLIIALWSAVALAVAGFAVLMTRDIERGAYCPGEMNIGSGNAFGGPFTATNHFADAITDQSLITEPTLIYFGYTYCPDICPLDAARNAEAIRILEEKNISVTPVFITVDPERDTPEVLTGFVSYLHPKMVGVTGTNEEINKLKKLYGAYGQKVPSDDPRFYLVDHTAFSYLMTPAGFVAAYDRTVTAEQIADNIACHAKRGDLK